MSLVVMTRGEAAAGSVKSLSSKGLAGAQRSTVTKATMPTEEELAAPLVL